MSALRKQLPKFPLFEEGHQQILAETTVAERIAMMWPLAVGAAASFRKRPTRSIFTP